MEDDDSTGEGGPQTTGIDPPPGDDSTTGGGEGSSSGSLDTTTGEDPGGESSSSGGAVVCDFATTCDGAETIGGVSGDTSTPPVTATGVEPTWAQVQVSENDSGVFAEGMSATISLESVGGDWDLKAYLGDPGDSSGCTGTQQVSQTAGVDSVRFEWGESGTFANNVEDGTFIAVEIFPKDDVCVPGSSWSLTVSGGG